MSGADYTRQGAVAVIRLDNPPVNTLSHAVRAGLLAELDRANADAAVSAVVLTGAGRSFSAGADINELGTPKSLLEPNLLTLIREIEGSGKPVVAAVNGVATGGGLELALGCHYRVAAPGTQVSLPEVKLGLIPGAGGTQRLPRAVGLEMAVNLILSGALIAAEKLAKTGLFDEVIEGDLLAGAVAFANRMAALRPLPLLRECRVIHPDAEGFLQFARNSVAALAKGYPAPLKCTEAVAASLKPFEEGAQVERQLFIELVSSPQSKALRHAFLAERAASKVADAPEDTPTRPLRSAAVIGAGTMGSGIAMCFATSTLDVDRIGTFTRRPADVIGTHFFSPANVMKLLEIVRGRATGKDVLATVLGLAKKMGKTSVVSGVCDGFIGNRMLARYVEQALLLIEEGALPQQVDSALEKFGMAMGPFRVSDLAGATSRRHPSL
jgi:3-hydroxyacyl-CoA dehydrogenase